jgi:hypothetical protein
MASPARSLPAATLGIALLLAAGIALAPARSSANPTRDFTPPRFSTAKQHARPVTYQGPRVSEERLGWLIVYSLFRSRAVP